MVSGPVTAQRVHAPMVDGGLAMLGQRMGTALEQLAERGIDPTSVEITISWDSYDEHRDDWVAELSWPSAVEDAAMVDSEWPAAWEVDR